MDEGQSQINVWCSQFSKLIDDFLNLTEPYLLGKPLGNSGVSPKQQWLLKQLAISCNMSSESALLLINVGQLWDAEIIARSVTEGSLKFAYLCMGNEQERNEKMEEYWEILPDIAQLKTHNRISDFLELVDDPDKDIRWKPLKDLLLAEDVVDKIRIQYPRRERRQLQQKWAFLEIIQSLSKSGVRGFDGLTALAYNFGMSSHHVHKDGESTGMIWDRLQREPQRKISVEIAHSARILSDLSVMAMLRALMVFRLYDADQKTVLELQSNYDYLFSDLAQAQAEWYDIEYSNDLPKSG